MALISNQDWKSAQTGQVVVLTDEERRTLVAEGYPIPQRFPLSKAEERSLKKIRRKIKNKISAQESRRKKKEYMEELEKKVNLMEIKIIELENENRRLKEQISSTTSSLSAVPISKSTTASQEKLTKRLEMNCLEADLNSPKATIKSEPVEENLSAATSTRLAQNNNDNNALLIKIEPPPRDNDSKLPVSGPTAISTAAVAPTSTITGQPLQQNDTTCLADLVKNGQLTVDDQVINVAQRKDSTNSNGQQQPQTDDDYFIDDILMSQERQEVQQLVDGGASNDEVDLVANLVGVVCEPGDDISVVKSICDQINKEDGNHGHQIGRSSSASFSSFSSTSSCSLSSPSSASSTTSSVYPKDIALSSSSSASPSSSVLEMSSDRCNPANDIKADYKLGISDTVELIISK